MRLIERPFSPSHALSLVRSKVDPLLARLFASRGFTEPAHLPGADVSALVPVTELHNCEAMAELLAEAILNGDRLLVVNDYDADGATACAVMLRALEAFGANVGFFVPNRLEHGYGLTPEIVDIVARLGPKPRYLITVDNGISSFDGVERARQLGMEVLVTDHHLAPETLPAARLIVNPNQPACGFPSKALAGCGVAWYVCHALEANFRARGIDPVDDEFSTLDLLPIVAVGTVADVVPLDRNNQTLVALGLERLRRGDCPAGLKALAEVSGKELANLSTSDIAFGIGPRINAAGRLESMDVGVHCLTTDNEHTALELAQALDSINVRRREIEADTVEQAVADLIADVKPGRCTVTLFNSNWHQGVIGIVAGRIRELTYRPTFILAQADDGTLKGSGRSIPGFHLRDALGLVSKRHPGLLPKFGGHAMAAGVSVRADGFEEFAQAFEEVASELLTPADLQQVLEHDGSLSEDELSIATAELLRSCVWGQAFPEPLFCDEFRVVRQRLVGERKNHLQLLLQKGRQQFQAIKFRYGEEAQLPERVQVVYRLDVNTFRDERRCQLLVEHIAIDG